MASLLLSECLRPGDRIVVGQAVGEPVGLIAELFDLAPRLGTVDVFCGLSLNPAWEDNVPDAVRVTTYCGLGSVRKLVAREQRPPLGQDDPQRPPLTRAADDDRHLPDGPGIARGLR